MYKKHASNLLLWVKKRKCVVTILSPIDGAYNIWLKILLFSKHRVRLHAPNIDTGLVDMAK